MALSLLAALLLPSCLKESDDPLKPDQTIVLFGEEAYIKSFEQVFFGMDSLNDPSVDASLFGHVVRYSGLEPPDIRGEYEFAVRKLIYPQNGFETNDAVYFRFGGDFDDWEDYLHGQHHMITHCDIMIPGLDLNSNLFHTDTAYISGHGNSFTAYLSSEQEVATPYGSLVARYKLLQGIAISGERTVMETDSGWIPDDIRDARLMLYNKDVELLNASELTQELVDNILMMKGRLFVYMDEDSVTVFNKGVRPFIDWND